MQNRTLITEAQFLQVASAVIMLATKMAADAGYIQHAFTVDYAGYGAIVLFSLFTIYKRFRMKSLA
jgi:uncharacterized membrane protein